MKIWTSAFNIFPYSFDELVSAFWDRYPNSHARHIISEDVIEREVTADYIRTKKLIVKQGSSLLKRMPRWLSRMTEIRQVPTLEESIYDRHTNTLTTYTRNMHERCLYRPVLSEPKLANQKREENKGLPASRLLRSTYISVNSGRMSGMYESMMLMGFKKSVIGTIKGLAERLEERYGHRTLTLVAEKWKMTTKLREKLKELKEFKDGSTEKAANLVGSKISS